MNNEEDLLKDISRANLPQLNQLLEEAKGLVMPGTEDYYDPTLVQDIENMIFNYYCKKLTFNILNILCILIL